jgi:hypothetical protein
MLACSDGIAPVPHVSANDILIMLDVHPRGIMMAVGQELPLVVTPVNILNTPMVVPDSVPIQFSSDDPLRASVDANGTVHGIAPSEDFGDGPVPVHIVSRWTFAGITKAETTFVAVTATPPASPPTSLSIQPAPYPTDSTWMSFISGRKLPLIIKSQDGTVIPNPYAHFYSELGERQLFDIVNENGRLTMQVTGRIWIYATSNVYGVDLRDSVQFIGMGLGLKQIVLAPTLTGGATHLETNGPIPPCARVVFVNTLAVAVDISFDVAPSACVDGDATSNIVNLSAGQAAIRKFRDSGTYGWRATPSSGQPFPSPVTGQVHIKDHTEF